MADTQPTPVLSADDLQTAGLPRFSGERTVRRSRVSSGATPTASLPRPVPLPGRGGSVPPPVGPPRVRSNSRGGSGRRAANVGKVWLRLLFASVVVGVLVFFLAFASTVVGYVYIASQLPSPQELQTRQTVFVSSKILDEDGGLLYEVTDPHGGRRTYVSLDHISRYVIQATVATEDRDFYLHPGFDPVAIARAFYYNFSERRIVSGASTIPQQLARNVLLSPEERYEESAARKIKEIVLATELSRTYPKDTILEIYLNEAYYGNRAYGIEAAAETYFDVDAADLTLAQASFLAGLPQAPAVYDPFGGGYDQTLARHKDVLKLMVEAGYIDDADAALAGAQIEAYEFKAPRIDLTVAPHFVVYVRQVLEAMYGPEALYRGTGLRVYTTLDRRLQNLAERAVQDGVAALADRNATNGALVAIDPSTGHILAMVGSAGFNNETIDGQVNVALRCRQPGSSIKPLTYVAAFERGWTPATLLWDLKKQFPDGANPPYVPVNYDGEYHGPMLVRKALANSYNVPAVEALQFVGVDGLLDMASRLGVQSLVHPEVGCPDYPYDQPPPYGLALTLGGGEVKLLEMVGAFAVFANDGIRVAPSPILRIEDSQGNVLMDNATPAGEQVIRPQHAYLITSILSDVNARCIEFGCPNALQLSRPAAAKTGTTNDYRDAWTIGYTPDLVAGVWVGNSDNSEMLALPGSAGAGPIWHNFMEAALESHPVRDFVRPEGVTDIEICADCGARASEYCPRHKSEVFAQDQPPLDVDEGWYRKVRIDEPTGLLANDYCPDHVVEKVMVVIEDLQDREWAQAHPGFFGNTALAPLEECTESTIQPIVVITDPPQGGSVQGVVSVFGTVQLPNFDHYQVQFGAGGAPQAWIWISGPHLAQVREGPLTEWDTRGLDPGVYTLRVRAFDKSQRTSDGQVTVTVLGPTPTPTLTATVTTTASPTVESTATLEPSPTASPTTPPVVTVIVPTATDTLTPKPTQTLVPTLAASATPNITGSTTLSGTLTPTP